MAVGDIVEKVCATLGRYRTGLCRCYGTGCFRLLNLGYWYGWGGELTSLLSTRRAVNGRVTTEKEELVSLTLVPWAEHHVTHSLCYCWWYRAVGVSPRGLMGWLHAVLVRWAVRLDLLAQVRVAGLIRPDRYGTWLVPGAVAFVWLSLMLRYIRDLRRG